MLASIVVIRSLILPLCSAQAFLTRPFCASTMPAESLTPWLQTQLATLYEQSSNHESKSPFSLHAELWSNHEKVAADTFVNQLRGAGQVFASRKIEWLHVYETSEGESANTTDGPSQHSQITDHGSQPHVGLDFVLRLPSR
jgi:hypothetical protein